MVTRRAFVASLLVLVSSLALPALAAEFSSNFSPELKPAAAPIAGKARKVLIISAEQGGVFATGGLAHATSGLAKALTEAGVQTDVLMPYYEDIDQKVKSEIKPAPGHIQVGLDFSDAGVPRKVSSFGVFQRKSDGVRTMLLKHDAPSSQNYFYNPRTASGPKFYAPPSLEQEAFGAFSKAATQFALENGYDAVILNDWTAGLVAPFMQDVRATGAKTPKVITAIHNMGYQGIMPKHMVQYLGIKPKHFNVDGLEYYDQVNALKAGINLSDAVYTVSPQYSQEIGTTRFGHGLEGVIQKKQEEGRVTGILNGIDSAEWDPARQYHPVVKYTFTPEDLSGKAKGKELVQAQFGLPVRAKTPVIAMTSRVADQKGFEYLIPAIEEMASKRDVQFVIVGDGEARYIERIKELMAKYPDKIHYSGFSADKEKILTAYSDFFLNGAKYEPSGLNQFFSMKNGTIPIVSNVGGLANSVKEGQTGFLGDVHVQPDGVTVDNEKSARSMFQLMDRAVETYHEHPDKIAEMRRTAMREDHSWGRRVAEFKSFLEYLYADGPQKIAARGTHERLVGLGPSQLLSEVRPAARVVDRMPAGMGAPTGGSAGEGCAVKFERVLLEMGR